jgi:hypothetical protein
VKCAPILSAAVAALLLPAQVFPASPPASPGAPDSATVATASAQLQGAARGRLDTPTCRVYLKAPRSGADGITYRAFEDPVPENALHLPRTVPWSDVQSLEVRGPRQLPLVLGFGALGAVVGHLLWTGSSRGVTAYGRTYRDDDRQVGYIVGGMGVGMVTGLVVNLWASRARVVYPEAGK